MGKGIAESPPTEKPWNTLLSERRFAKTVWRLSFLRSLFSRFRARHYRGPPSKSTVEAVLHEFLSTHREAILARTRAKVLAHAAPGETEDEIDGIALFLDQLIEILRSSPDGIGAIAQSAAIHGAALLKRGFTVAQVVHDYGGVCQVVTELAGETHALITADEFRVFNRCLDDAIAQAVTEYTHQRERTISEQGREHLGELAHELRNAVGAATVSFEVLRMGKVGLEGSTAGVLGRSLRRLSTLIDTSLTEVRLDAGPHAPERVAMRGLLEQIAVGASMEASSRSITLVVAPGDPEVFVHVDRLLLAASIANLLQNAFKFSRPEGQVSLATSATREHVLFEIADQCPGLPPGMVAELLLAPEERTGTRPTIGVGLDIARRSVEACGGGLTVREVPDIGCIFTMKLPRG
jgi:signal transduction histidine kinase